jgi:hypothetical protein
MEYNGRIVRARKEVGMVAKIKEIINQIRKVLGI